jgi:phenylacetate-CoA ligase
MTAAAPMQPYWNPKNETMPREALRALQLLKLRRLCAFAVERSPFHRRRFAAAGLRPEALRTWEDLHRIPFMTREELMASQAAGPPFGDLLADDSRTAVRYHLTSGSSGSTPIRVLDGLKDWEWAAEMWCYGLWGFGVRPADTVYLAFGYGSFIGFWGAHYACEKIGALVVPGGAQSTESRVRQLLEVGATTLCSTPTYALRLAQEAVRQGIELPRDARVERLIVSGEPAGSIPSAKRQLERAWGARCGDAAGMTEIGTLAMFECSAQPGGLHIIEDHMIEEVVDPDSGEPLPYGTLGERVVTSFGRGLLPLIRYRTRDMVVKVPYSACSCGRTTDLYRGGIRGRWDDMKVVRGTNVYARSVEEIVRAVDAIEEFQIYLWRADDLRDEITVRVELRTDWAGDWDGVARRLVQELGCAHEGLRFNVERVASGSLPRFELKAKRLVDDRPAAGYGDTAAAVGEE